MLFEGLMPMCQDDFDLLEMGVSLQSQEKSVKMRNDYEIKEDDKNDIDNNDRFDVVMLSISTQKIMKKCMIHYSSISDEYEIIHYIYMQKIPMQV